MGYTTSVRNKKRKLMSSQGAALIYLNFQPPEVVNRDRWLKMSLHLFAYFETKHLQILMSFHFQ